MALFRSYFYNSQEQYFYLLKVVNPGKFRVGPAKVEAYVSAQVSGHHRR